MKRRAAEAVGFAAGALWTHAHGAEPWYVVCVAASVGCAVASFYIGLLMFAGAQLRKAGLGAAVKRALRRCP